MLWLISSCTGAIVLLRLLLPGELSTAVFGLTLTSGCQRKLSRRGGHEPLIANAIPVSTSISVWGTY